MVLLDFFQRGGGQKKGVVVLVLDVGTEFVKALVCKVGFGAEGGVEVLGYGKQRQDLGDMQAGAVLDIASVIENCEVAVAAAEKEAGVRAEQMVMGIGGELVKGKSTVVNYTREDAERAIDLGELKNIVHKVQWQAFDQIRRELAVETGHEEIEVKLVNAAVMKVEIDGQVASNPLGFKGKNLVLQVFNAFAPLSHFGAMQTVAAELRADLLGIVAQQYALARCLESEDGGDLSAVFVDVGGGTTDVAVVEGGAVVGMKTFGLGGRTFTKRLSAGLNVSFREAEKIKLAYGNGELDRNSAKIVRGALENDAQVWLAGLELALGDFCGVEVLPSRVLVCGGGAKLPEIMNVLGTREWVKRLNFGRMPRVSLLEPGEVGGVVDGTERLGGVESVVPLALVGLSRELAGEEAVLHKILRNMSSLLQN